jgi:hypothetical protein
VNYAHQREKERGILHPLKRVQDDGGFGLGGLVLGETTFVFAIVGWLSGGELPHSGKGM